MARPRKIVDEKRVIELASKGHTLEEIAAFENVSYDTLHRRFASACEKGKLLCDGQIRRKQVEKAISGSDTMLIWLGKQRLGQTDKQEVSGKVEHEHSIVRSFTDAELAIVRGPAEAAIARRNSGRVLSA